MHGRCCVEEHNAASRENLLISSCLIAARRVVSIVLAQAPENRITGRIEEAQVTTLLGNVHPMARREFDEGVIHAETPLGQMMLQLQPSAAQQAALETLMEAQHDPNSTLYHQWLTPAQYGARFGASEQDLATITGWLAGHGFTVYEVPVNHRQIIFSGTEAQVEDTFHSEIHHYLVGDVSHIANSQDPQIPTALAGVVGGIVSLHDFRHVSDIGSREAAGPSTVHQRERALPVSGRLGNGL